jgi:hypothetical protein
VRRWRRKGTLPILNSCAGIWVPSMRRTKRSVKKEPWSKKVVIRRHTWPRAVVS